MNRLKTWLKAATNAEKRMLALQAATTSKYINQLANGSRNASPEMAGRISAAAQEIRQREVDRIHRLPILTRGNLNSQCAACIYYRDCHDE